MIKNIIMLEIQTGTLELGHDYYAVDPAVAEALGLNLEGITGIFSATLNDGSTWYFIPIDSTIDDEIYDILMENDALGFLSYIDSKSGIGDL